MFRVLYYICHVNKRNGAIIRARIAWSQYDALQQVRRSVKGLRISNLWTIRLLGEVPGSRACELVKISGECKQVISGRLNLCIKSGMIYRESKRYYLSDKGRLVYDILNTELNAGMEAIISSMVKEARKRL